MNYKLCYVEKQWAYFTTQELKDQWGDDWNDAPYEHNAGKPYTPCWHNQGEEVKKRGKLCECDSCKRDWNSDGTEKWSILKVAFDGYFESPKDKCTNSGYSVEEINAGAVAWLAGTFSESNKPAAIQAGASLSKFFDTVTRCGGNVYTKVDGT